MLGIEITTLRFLSQAKLETATELSPIEKAIINSWTFCP
jgi:hypothetical protein